MKDGIEASNELPENPPKLDPSEFVECVDSLPEACEKELKPYNCYNFINRSKCCATCKKLRELSDGEIRIMTLTLST